jgi:outer membrane protein assembly factor BamA
MLLLAIGQCLQAQNSYELVIVPIDKDSAFVSGLKLQPKFTSKEKRDEYVTTLPSILHGKGYVVASLDSIAETGNQTTVYFFIGDEYQLERIKISPESIAMLPATGKNRPVVQRFTFDEFSRFQKDVLDGFENSGYPFAQLKLDSIKIIEQRVNAVLTIDRGRFYKVDSVHILGPAKISRNFIHRYLDIERGSPYNQQKFSTINQRLLELPYLQQVQPWDVTMLNTGSIVNLYLQPQKSNQVNVLAGFLPDNQQLGGKLLFTIDANLQLKNAFSTGEQIGLVWQQIQPRSPRLDIQYQQPYLFNSPIGLDFSFNLFKKDSLFLNLNAAFGLRYMISANHWIKVGVQNQRTNVLEVDTTMIKRQRLLPDIADVSAVNLNVAYEINKTDYRFNPRKGNMLNVNVEVGTKTIRKNNSVTQIKDATFNYNSLYDSVKLNTYQVRVRASAAHYIKLGRQSVLKTALNAGLYESPNAFKNELFQIGGYRLLRGFDEESIYANRYGVGTLEYRLLLGLNSYFFGFTDVGASRFKSLNLSTSNTYIGAGAGIAVETKGGIFNISFAAGKRNDVPFNVREAKIHLGYVSVF